MASISALSILAPSSHIHLTSSSFSFRPNQLQFSLVRFQNKIKISAITSSSSKRRFLRPSKIRSLAEEEQTLVLEAEASQPPAAATTEQTVSVPVSPSDVLTMFFQAEGSMIDAAIPIVTEALEGLCGGEIAATLSNQVGMHLPTLDIDDNDEVEGVSHLKVGVREGIASVKLRKQTTVQATGVASSLVEIIQGSGFKLQTLNLSFQDEEDMS